MKLNSIEYSFEILKRHFHPYTYFLCDGPCNDKMFFEAQGMRTHCFYSHMLLQSTISLKPQIQMKNWKIPILVYENKFPMQYGRTFDILCGVLHTCLNLLYMRQHFVQTCVASNKHISQTRKPNGKPWNAHFRWWKKIKMSYIRPIETSYRYHNISLKFTEVDSPP